MPEATEITTSDQEQKLREWKKYAGAQGIPLNPSTLQMIITNVQNGIRPPETTDRRVPSETEQRLQSGEGIVDFLPEELAKRPDVPIERKLTELEKNLERIHKELKLTEYKPPPGEVIDMHDVEWAEYGWAPAEKHQVEELFHTVGLHEEQIKHAKEVLLIAGMSAEDVLTRLSDPQVQAELRAGHQGVRWSAFAHYFPELPRSSLNAVFNEEMRQGHAYNNEPETTEEFAWQLSWSGTDGGPNGLWMYDQKYPLLEIRAEEKIDEHGKKKLLGEYFINETNFMRWFRRQIDILYDIHGPNGKIDVMHDVKLEKDSEMYSIPFRRMLEAQGKLFKSENGKTEYLQMWLQLQWEANMFQTLYDNDILYRQAMVDTKTFVGKYKEMTWMNPLTKLGFRTNMIQRLLIGSQEYKEGRAGLDDDKYLSDNKTGAAFVEMVLAYYNLGDFAQLKKVLGADSSFFTVAGWDKAFADVDSATRNRAGGAITLTRERTALFEKAFDRKTGTIKDKNAFIDFINLFTTNLPDAYLELAVRRAIQNSVSKRYDFRTIKQVYSTKHKRFKEVEETDDISLGLTEAEAWFFNRFMGGAARNDLGTNDKGPNPSVHDKMSELVNMDSNRRKYLQGEGKPYGNEQTIGRHLSAAVIPMLAITTGQEVPVYDEYGRHVKDKKGKPMYRRKSILQVFEELHELRVKQQKRLKHLEGKLKDVRGNNQVALLKAIQDEAQRSNRTYQDIVARDASFNENAQREYVAVHLEPGLHWMERIMSGEGIDLNDFNNYDAFGGVTFNREKFIKKVQKELIGTTRDMWKKYHWVNFNEDIRAPFFNPITKRQEFRQVKLGQTLFGYDVLNREEFWRKDEHGHPIKRNGFHEIDFNLVQQNKLLVMKQAFLTELAGDFYRHQIANSGDIRYNQAYYMNALEALQTITGKVVIDELAKHGIHVKENFIDKKDLAWLKARALNGKILFWDAGAFGFHLKWWLSSLWDKTDKDGMGFGKMFSIIAKEAFAGGVTA